MRTPRSGTLAHGLPSWSELATTLASCCGTANTSPSLPSPLSSADEASADRFIQCYAGCGCVEAGAVTPHGGSAGIDCSPVFQIHGVSSLIRINSSSTCR